MELDVEHLVNIQIVLIYYTCYTPKHVLRNKLCSYKKWGKSTTSAQNFTDHIISVVYEKTMQSIFKK